MKKYYFTIERLKILHEGFGYLDNYITPPDGVVHHIGPNINTEDANKTKLLREFGKINVRREQIINYLLK
jgi:hypothetical protein